MALADDPPLKAGDLNRRVTVQVRAGAGEASPDANAEPPSDWSDVCTVWASVGPLKGQERVVASQYVAEIDFAVRLRWSPLARSITAKQHRLIYEGRTLNIVAPPQEIGFRYGLLLLVAEEEGV